MCSNEVKESYYCLSSSNKVDVLAIFDCTSNAAVEPPTADSLNLFCVAKNWLLVELRGCSFCCF